MKPLVSRWVRIRLMIVALVYFAGLGLILTRAFYLQVLDRPRLAELAARQHSTEVRLAPKRGTIFDRNMQELAGSVAVSSVYAHPGALEVPQEAARALAGALDLKAGKLLEKFKGGAPFVWVKRHATPAEAQAVRALELEGVGFTKERRRYYPHRTLAAKLLGFVGMDAKGLEGLELYYDETLRGEEKTLVATRDGLRRLIIVEDPGARGARDGHGIVLTIDRAIQYIAEKALASAVEKTGAKRGMAIVMDPKTGDILALAEAPTFNPNLYARSSPEIRHSWSFSMTYEPGSTFKVFVVAAALEVGAVDPGNHFYCEQGAYRYGGHVIHDVHPYGWLNVAGVVKHSSNIGAMKIAERLGSDRLYQYIRAFGFGSRSGAGFPSDLPGIVPPLKRWRKITRGTIAFGQGISVTPIQITTALAAIANGGILMKPRLVTAQVDPSGRVIKSYEPVQVRRVISDKTARTIARFMHGVTQEGGTGKAARVDGYHVAGKTGTAQKVKEGKRGYSSGRIGSFIGFVPVKEPRLAISVIIDEPRGIPYGGRVAAPVFRQIAEKALGHLGVSSDPSARTIPAVAPAPVRRYEVRRRGSGQARTETRGGLTVYAPRRRGAVPAVKPVVLGPRVPDFSGLSIRGAMRRAQSENVSIKINGSGLAKSQSPAPGSAFKPGMTIKVQFSSPGSS